MREKGSPCPQCQQVEICAKCKSDIAEAEWVFFNGLAGVGTAQRDIIWNEIHMPKDWWGETAA